MHLCSLVHALVIYLKGLLLTSLHVIWSFGYLRSELFLQARCKECCCGEKEVTGLILCPPVVETMHAANLGQLHKEKTYEKAEC